MWSSTLSELPETYDEKLAREDFEKRGAIDERALMAMALAKMTGLDLPETLAARITGTPQHVPSATVPCPDGHVNPATAKFCTECGQAVIAAAPAAKAAVAEPPAKADEAPAAESLPAVEPSGDTTGATDTANLQAAFKAPTNREIRDMKRADLVALAKARGLPDTGSRAELIGRLLKARP